MNCTHAAASVTTGGGGIPEALCQLAFAQHAADIGVEVVGFDDGRKKIVGWPGDNPRSLPVKVVTGFPWSCGYDHTLEASVPDLLHSHGLWQQPSVVVPRLSRRLQIPWLVSPHGMLDPWSLVQSRWKKRLAAILFEGRHLRGAACIHALCQSEADSIRAYGLKNPIAIIPNGVDLVEDRDQGSGGRGQESGRKILLFLGRLHPKKGLVNALRAWAQIRGQGTGDRAQEEWQFVIAGWDQGGHEAELKRLCDELGLAWGETQEAGGRGQESGRQEAEVRSQASVREAAADSFACSKSLIPDSCPLTPIVFTGPAFGDRKDALLRRADAFILPSFSEGLPMSVLEAWSYRLPVLMTEHCNLPEGFAADAAIRIGTGIRGQEAGGRNAEAAVAARNHKRSHTAWPEHSGGNQGAGDRDQPMGIDEGMRALFEMTDAERMVMGQHGRALVERQFTWPQVAAQMKEVYEWVLGDGEVPGCVVL
jgi:glycosyltransferase involved in cell wall biosynthesis